MSSSDVTEIICDVRVNSWDVTEILWNVRVVFNNVTSFSTDVTAISTNVTQYFTNVRVIFTDVTGFIHNAAENFADVMEVFTNAAGKEDRGPAVQDKIDNFSCNQLTNTPLYTIINNGKNLFCYRLVREWKNNPDGPLD